MQGQPANIESTDHAKPGDTWLTRATSAWQISTSYYETNNQARLVKDQSLFDSKHPPGSKYHNQMHRFRSRLFRPKIRSAGRKLEAAAVQAFFSTIDAIDIAPADDTNQKQVIASKLVNNLVKHHLTNTMRWYQNCIGGVQDAFKTGLVVSYNYWLRKVAKYTVEEPVYDEMGNVVVENGEQVFKTIEKEDVLEDRPCVDLLPINRVRYHPAADWIDPMNSSPFVCLIWPTYICEIKAKMRDGEWNTLTDDEIKLAKLSMSDDAAETKRRGGKEDPLDLQTPGVGDYDVSTCLLWFMVGDDGRRYQFWTLGTQHRLTDPVLIKKEYPHNRVPVTMGYCFLEAHKSWPVSGPTLGEDLSKEANDLANGRLDNIKFALNKRYIARRGGNVDVKSLTINAPGSVTMAEDINADVREVEFNDINPSAYAEQDRVNVDMDELLGNFSQGSVQSNRSLNETVGGMQLAHGSAGQITDFDLRTIVETWMEPTLRQITSLVQHYETDEDLLTKAGNQEEIDGEVDDKLLKGDIHLTVNVGVGASNPVFKAQQFIGAVKQFAEILTMQLPGLQTQELASEIFGYIGYKDGSRFFKLDEEGGNNPQVQELQAELQKLTQKIESKELELTAKKAIDQMALQQKTAADRKAREVEEENNKRDNATRIKVALLSNKAKEKAAKVTSDLKREELKSQEDMFEKSDETARQTAKMSGKEKPKESKLDKESSKQRTLKSLKIVKKNGETSEIVPEFGEGEQGAIKVNREDKKSA